LNKSYLSIILSIFIVELKDRILEDVKVDNPLDLAIFHKL